jgi:hypothetical protein
MPTNHRKRWTPQDEDTVKRTFVECKLDGALPSLQALAWFLQRTVLAVFLKAVELRCVSEDNYRDLWAGALTPEHVAH